MCHLVTARLIPSARVTSWYRPRRYGRTGSPARAMLPWEVTTGARDSARVATCDRHRAGHRTARSGRGARRAGCATASYRWWRRAAAAVDPGAAARVPTPGGTARRDRRRGDPHLRQFVGRLVPVLGVVGVAAEDGRGQLPELRLPRGHPA